MTAIGMNVSRWIGLMRLENWPGNGGQSWSQAIERDGDDENLFDGLGNFDQRLISIRIHQWLKQHRNDCVTEGKRYKQNDKKYLELEGGIPSDFDKLVEIVLPKSFSSSNFKSDRRAIPVVERIVGNVFNVRKYWRQFDDLLEQHVQNEQNEKEIFDCNQLMNSTRPG